MADLKADPKTPFTLSSSSITPASSLNQNEIPTDAFIHSIKAHGLTLNEAQYLRWDNSNPKHPRNWTGTRKTYNSTVILLLEFITSAAGTAGTSAAHEAQRDYRINLSLTIFCLTSTYLIGQGIGGIFFPPYSESFGRKTLYIVSTIAFCIFSAITASVHSLPVLIIARFLMGLSSSIPTVVTAGSIEDMFNMKARVWMIFTWVAIGNVAICVGPIYSTYVTANLGWRWVFYMATIGLGGLFIFVLLLRESRPSLLLEREVSRLRRSNPNIPFKTLNPDSTPDFRTFIQVTLIRPLRLLFTEPIVMTLAIMGSIACAIFYVSAESLLLVFQAYGWSEKSASLSFIPVMLGCLGGFATRFYDNRHLARRIKRGQPLEPEHKMLGFAIAAPSVAIGLWIFAWTIPPATSSPWIIPMLSLIPIGYALNENDYVLTGYLADSYTIYAASGFAGLILARCVTCAVIVPFTRPMFEGLGYNMAMTVFAGVATIFCVAPVVFWRWGRGIRERSRFARVSLGRYMENSVEDDMNVGGYIGEEGQGVK